MPEELEFNRLSMAGESTIIISEESTVKPQHTLTVIVNLYRSQARTYANEEVENEPCLARSPRSTGVVAFLR